MKSLFIDQPVGVGFSYGDTEVGTSQEAAADVWSVSQHYSIIVCSYRVITIPKVLANLVLRLAIQ
jgi:carboxypeptidase C (cathepsin A)